MQSRPSTWRPVSRGGPEAVRLPPPVRRGESGFTLVDVMMGAIILVVGFMGMIQAITIGSEMLATARRQTLAAQIIDHEIGQLRLGPWSQVSNTPPAVIGSQFDAAIAASGATWSISKTVNTISTDLKEVTITVTWTMRPSGISVSRTYTRKNSAYFGKYGLNLSYQRS